jgi:hypothetical protein
MTIEILEKNLNEALVLSVIVAAAPMKELPETLAAARVGLDALGIPYEVICITDGRDQQIMNALESMQTKWQELVVLGQRPWAGDDAALAVALRRARASLVLTTAGWPEVVPEDFAGLLAGLGNADMVSAVRTGVPAGRWQSMRQSIFRRLLGRLFGQSPADPFCRTRLTRKAVLEDVAGFGVRQHFIPVIAGQRGYKLSEVELRSAATDTSASSARYVFRPLGHLTAFLDALTLYVVLKFLRRPLRFFGSIGLPIFLLGAISTAVLLTQKFFGEPLADRPALIFAVLMVVLGIQIVAIGLVGEIIIFANSRRMKQYAVRDIIRQDGAANPYPGAPKIVAPDLPRSDIKE